MSRIARTSPQSAADATLRLSRFEQLVEVFPRWDGRIEQLTCGRFAGTVLVGAGSRLGAYHATANQSILIKGRDRPGRMSVALVLPDSSECLWRHRRLDAGSLVVRGADADADHQSSRRAVHLELSLGEEQFSATARTLARVETGPVGWFGARPRPDAFRELETRVREFLLAANAPSAAPADTGVMEQSCLRAAVEALYPVTTRRVDLPLPARTALVRRADELMGANFRMPLGEIDLCTELGVSGRTLRLAFRERYGLGPMAYYQAIRLNAARAALKTARSGDTSVERIGRAFGFAHPGKFSGYYRRLFGELPSETARGLDPVRVGVAWSRTRTS